MNRKNLGIGDWGLGIGDWGLGIGPNPQSPIPKFFQQYHHFKISNFKNKIKIKILNLNIF
jgi:hypothetical protein